MKLWTTHLSLQWKEKMSGRILQWLLCSLWSVSPCLVVCAYPCVRWWAVRLSACNWSIKGNYWITLTDLQLDNWFEWICNNECWAPSRWLLGRDLEQVFCQQLLNAFNRCTEVRWWCLIITKIIIMIEISLPNELRVIVMTTILHQNGSKRLLGCYTFGCLSALVLRVTWNGWNFNCPLRAWTLGGHQNQCLNQCQWMHGPASNPKGPIANLCCSHIYVGRFWW